MAILDAGTYRAKALEAKLGLSANGNEQVGVRFGLLDREGESITWYGTFTEAAFEIAMRGLRAAGWTGDDLSDLSSLSGETPQVNLVIDHETYKGKTAAKVKFINSAGIAMRQALDVNQARAFAERMKGKVVLFNQQAGTPRAKQPVRAATDNGPPPPEDTDAPPEQGEEIPF